jgi:hypothetical protein
LERCPERRVESRVRAPEFFAGFLPADDRKSLMVNANIADTPLMFCSEVTAHYAPGHTQKWQGLKY